MRVFASLVACAGVALTVAGCDPVTDNAYFSKGVGTDLYSQDVVAQTDLQNLYVKHICRQAGLAEDNCAIDTFSPTTWSLFVQAGMNDIDQRCDAYLTWIDNVRRSQAPMLKQINDTYTATELIMQATGAGVGSMAVVAAAFGLATNTFSNVNSRLLLEVNHSTVQSVVLTRQRNFRMDLLGNPATRSPGVVIASKPAAIYALRSYLRLCMPITIETEINNTVTGFERGGGEALDNREPMISATSVGVANISNVNAPTPSGPKPPPPLAGDIRFGKFERPIPPDTIKAYQRALCVSPVDGLLGSKESVTRAHISEYLRAIRATDTSREFDAKTQGLLQRAVRRVGDCSAKNYKNAFEIGKYGVADDTSLAIKGLQRDLVTALQKKGLTVTLDQTGTFGPDNSTTQDPTRTAIAQFRLRSLNPDAVPSSNDVRDPQNRQLTDAVNRAILLAR